MGPAEPYQKGVKRLCLRPVPVPVPGRRAIEGRRKGSLAFLPGGPDVNNHDRTDPDTTRRATRHCGNRFYFFDPGIGGGAHSPRA